jgi:hypothetical protein
LKLFFRRSWKQQNAVAGLDITIFDQALRPPFFPLQAGQALRSRVQLASQSLELHFFGFNLAPEQGIVGQAALNHGRQNEEDNHEKGKNGPAATLLTETESPARSLRIGKVTERVPLRIHVVPSSTTWYAARAGNVLVVYVYTSPLH